MADPKGDVLYVNVGASEARRRLKRFGHGVRKVRSAGKNQALVIHTATGRHRKELQSKFADVGYADERSELSEPVQNLRNLGPTSAAWLTDVGIPTITELRRLGPALAYRLVKQRRPDASRNLLWAMAAGLADRDWRDLTDEEKSKLLADVDD